MSPDREAVRDSPIGRLSIVLAAIIAPAFAALQGAGLALKNEFAFAIATRPDLATNVAAGITGALIVLLVVSALSVVQQARRPDRSRGRLRLLVVGMGGLVSGLAMLIAGGFAASAGVTLYRPGLGFDLTGSAQIPLLALAALAGTGQAAALIASLASWPMIPAQRRAKLWILFDVLVLAATAYALFALPAQPPAETPNTLGPAVARHVITTIFALRLLARMMPLLLDGIEAAGFRSLVASRHLRSKKSGFLAAISVLSVLAVTVSSCALTTTLSVMGGFRQDLKRKILGNNAHVVVDREHATIEGWEPLLAQTRAHEGVVGASPFVNGEVMISSAANLGTAVLRGIDPSTVGDVNDLPANMRSGNLEFLTHPERLLDEPPDRLRDTLMPMMPDPGAGQGDLQDAARPGEDALDTEQLKARIAALDEFLKGATAPAPSPDPAPRDVLPGIVIGQELARSLRLYVGDEVNVVAPLGALGPQGLMPKARPFRVAGIFYSGMYEYDMKFAYVALKTAQRFLGTGEAISGIEVKVDQVDRAPAIAAGLRADLKRDGLRVKDWQELNSRLFGALALEKLAMFIALGIAILVASFCIAGTLTLMVQEKGREVAILKAMGTADRTIVGVFVIEGGLIGVLGAALGLFLGYMMCFAAEHFGIRMNPEVYYIDRLPVHIDGAEFALTGVAAVLICLLITVYPALLASRLRPVDALRYE